MPRQNEAMAGAMPIEIAGMAAEQMRALSVQWHAEGIALPPGSPERQEKLEAAMTADDWATWMEGQDESEAADVAADAHDAAAAAGSPPPPSSDGDDVDFTLPPPDAMVEAAVAVVEQLPDEQREAVQQVIDQIHEAASGAGDNEGE
jgi:hypothetical protein